MIKPDLAAIDRARLARLQQDRASLARRIAHLRTAQEMALLKARAVKCAYLEAKRKRI